MSFGLKLHCIYASGFKTKTRDSITTQKDIVGSIRLVKTFFSPWKPFLHTTSPRHPHQDRPSRPRCHMLMDFPDPDPPITSVPYIPLFPPISLLTNHIFPSLCVIKEYIFSSFFCFMFYLCILFSSILSLFSAFFSLLSVFPVISVLHFSYFISFRYLLTYFPSLLFFIISVKTYSL